MGLYEICKNVDILLTIFSNFFSRINVPYKRFMTAHIPESIGNLSNIQRIYLNSNFLNGTIPESIGNFLQLQVLILNTNRLSGQLPKSFTTTNYSFF